MEKIEIEVETKKLVELVKAVSLNGLVVDPVLRFGENGVKAWNTDIGNAVAGYLNFKRDYFINYNIPDECKICFESSKLLKLLSYIKGENTVLTLETEKAVIKSNGQEVTFPLLEPGNEMKLISLLREEDDKVVITNPYPISLVMENLSKDVLKLGELETSLIIKENKLFMEQRSDDGYVFSDSIVSVPGVDDLRINLSTEYLTGILGSLIGKEVRLNINTKSIIPETVMPIVIENDGDGYRLLFIIAPRIPHDV